MLIKFPDYRHANLITINLAFIMVAFGYMLPWTALGSLIPFYKNLYGPSFYVKLCASYYLPGFPISILQQKFDSYLDDKFSSKTTFMIRGIFCFVFSQVLFLLLTLSENETELLVLTLLLGVFGWMCHGTASMLVSLFPSSSIAYLQIGFRCPEICTLVMVIVLNINEYPTTINLDKFFIVNVLFMSLGLISWIFILNHDTTLSYLSAKDNRSDYVKGYIGEGGISEFKHEVHDDDLSSAISPTKTVDDSSYCCLDNDVESPPPLTESFPTVAYVSVHGGAGCDQEAEHEGTHQMVPFPSTTSSSSDCDCENTKDPVCHELSLGKSSQAAFNTDADEVMRVTVRQTVRVHCIALFLLIGSSIFQASFFAYVKSPDAAVDITQIIYFVRLFFDLLGRPLTLLPRPHWLTHGWQLAIAAGLRLSLLVAFFLYITTSVIPRSDVFICVIVAVHSLLSGYFAILLYEYAARDVQSKAAKTYAATLLNTTFQFAAFTSVVASMIVSSTKLFSDFDH